MLFEKSRSSAPPTAPDGKVLLSVIEQSNLDAKTLFALGQKRKWPPLKWEVRCTLKSGRRQAQGEFHSIAHVSMPSLSRSARANALALLQRLFAREQLRPQAPARYIIEVEESGFPAVGKSNLEATAPRHGFMLDDADAVWHPAIIAVRMRACARRPGGGLKPL
jgi:hypothetical protein